MLREAAVSGIQPSQEASTARRLLTAGVVAGPLFLIVVLIQAVARPGFDWIRHPLSLLSLGVYGWVQIANFVVSGILFIAAASGMRRVLHPGRGARWAPLLVGAFGVALIAGGVFVADPAFGFPPGTPEGRPDRLSWHGIVHAIAPAVGFLSLIAACFVMGRRFATTGERGWAWYSYATGAVVLALSAVPPSETFVALWAAAVVGFIWPSVVAAKLMSRLPG